MIVRMTGFGFLQMTIPGYSHWSPINYGYNVLQCNQHGGVSGHVSAAQQQERSWEWVVTEHT